ncbi:MAG: PAS domain-containing sensor histidine kinase, partial [Chloroflexi bacterium]
RTAIEAAGAVTYYQDYAKNTYSFMSESIRKLTGYGPDEMTPLVWDGIVQQAVIQGEGRDLPEEETIRRVRSGEIGAWKCDYLIRARDGQLRWIADSAVEARNEGQLSHGSIGIMQDITERKWALEEVQRLNAELEQRVIQRTTQLESANKELESFSYSVSHDLRAPLRGINSFSQILLNDFSGQLDPVGRSFLDKVVKASQEMNGLIESLLLLSRLNRGELRRSDVDLSALASIILERLSQAEPERSVNCVVTPGLWANADERLIRNVLENLLGNAWKYTSKVPTPGIEFGMEKMDGQDVFFVRDNGVGFDMKYANKLFGTFQRLHNAEEFPGHGIGLATVQRIIHRHGGKVWAQAEAKKGATFFFTLPS